MKQLGGPLLLEREFWTLAPKLQVSLGSKAIVIVMKGNLGIQREVFGNYAADFELGSS